MSRLHVIFITGLGDANPRAQRTAVNWWRLWGVKPELFQMNWANEEAWPEKFSRLLTRIDELSKNGAVGLVAASAGASPAIAAFAERKAKVVGVVCITGKINHPETIGQSFSYKNPALIDAVRQCQAALNKLNDSDRKRIMSRYAFADEMVRQADSVVPGAVNKKLFSFGHFLTILSQVTLGAPFYLRFLKKIEI